MRGKHIAWTPKPFLGHLFVPLSDTFPMYPEKKTLIPYISMYHASDKDFFEEKL